MWNVGLETGERSVPRQEVQPGPERAHAGKARAGDRILRIDEAPRQRLARERLEERLEAAFDRLVRLDVSRTDAPQPR